MSFFTNISDFNLISNTLLYEAHNLFSTHELQIKTQNSIIYISVYSNIFSTFLSP